MTEINLATFSTHTTKASQLKHPGKNTTYNEDRSEILELQQESEIAYIVFYHNDLDGLVSACLFNLRGVPALNIDSKRVVYIPIDYDQEMDLTQLTEIAKKNMHVRWIRLISLDFSIEGSRLLNKEKFEVYMTIDHHKLAPSTNCRMVMHDPTAFSCARLVSRVFPSPNPVEDPDSVKKALEATDIVDTGGSTVGFAKLSETLLSRPGCAIFFSVNFKLTPKESMSLICNFMKGKNSKEERKLFAELIRSIKKLLKFKPLPERVDTIHGKKIAVFRFGATRTDALYFSISVLKTVEFNSEYSIIAFIRETSEYTYRVSIRSSVDAFDVHNFCSKFGGGGRATGAGGFVLNAKSTDEFTSKVDRIVETAKKQLSSLSQ